MSSEEANGWVDLKTISEESAKAMNMILEEALQKNLQLFYVLEVKKQIGDEETGIKYKLFMQKLLNFSEQEKKTLGFDTRVTRFTRGEKQWHSKMIYYCPQKDICKKYIENPNCINQLQDPEEREIVNMVLENARRLL